MKYQRQKNFGILGMIFCIILLLVISFTSSSYAAGSSGGGAPPTFAILDLPIGFQAPAVTNDDGPLVAPRPPHFESDYIQRNSTHFAILVFDNSPTLVEQRMRPFQAAVGRYDLRQLTSSPADEKMCRRDNAIKFGRTARQRGGGGDAILLVINGITIGNYQPGAGGSCG